MTTLLKNTAPVYAKRSAPSGLIQDSPAAGNILVDRAAKRSTKWPRQSSNDTSQLSVYHFVKDLDARSGGLSRSVPQICSELATQGLNISIISRHSATPLTMNGPECCLLSANARDADEYLRQRIHPQSNSIIHVNGLWLPFLNAGPRFAQAANVPYIVSPRGMTAPWAMRHKWAKKAVAWRLYQKRILQNAACLHATADSEMEHLRALGITAPISVIPNGVEIISNEKLSQMNAEAEKRAHPEIRTLLFLGRIQKVKGLDNLIRAWAKVRQPGWRIQIVGPEEDNHKAELERLARRLGVHADITFNDPQSNEAKWRTYHSADLFVLPTHTENFGLTVAEALGCETPVITTKGAPWSGIEEHKCGWWVDIGIDPLANAIQTAIGLTDYQRKEMGQRGRRMVMEKYAWSGIAQQVNEVYAWLSGQSTMPSCVKLAA